MSTKPYRKIAFVWSEPQPLVPVPARLTFRSYEVADRPALARPLGRAMSRSLDRSDQKNTRERDPSEAALAFIDEAGQDFDYRPGWWQLAFDASGTLAGFVLPVIFRGGTRGGLEEGTIYYLGVSPEARGRGYARDLLRKGTRVLQEVGVWRIYCDTDEVNAPMIAAFRETGYEQIGEPQERPLETSGVRGV